MACSMTKRCSSKRLKRDSGTPCVLGSSHAIALTCATSSGGKTARATDPRLVPQTLKALLAESSSPPTHRLPTHPQARADLSVGLAVCRHQHQLGPLHLQMRPRVTRSDVLKLGPLGLAQEHLVGLRPAITREVRRDDAHPFKRDGTYGEQHLAQPLPGWQAHALRAVPRGPQG